MNAYKQELQARIAKLNYRIQALARYRADLEELILEIEALQLQIEHATPKKEAAE